MLSMNGNSGNSGSNRTSTISELLGIWRETFFYLFSKKMWLVSFKTALQTYRILFSSFWWLIVICCSIQILFCNPLFLNLTSQLWPLLCWTFLSFINFLLVRSSLHKKDYNYFSSYAKKNYLFFLIIDCILLTCFVFLWLYYKAGSYLAFLFDLFIIVPLFCIYTFFYLDTMAIILKIKRVKSALLVLLYTAPYTATIMVGMILTGTFIWLLKIVIMLILNKLAVVQWIIQITQLSFIIGAIILCVPLFLSFIYTLYTKQVHDHYDLYMIN